MKYQEIQKMDAAQLESTLAAEKQRYQRMKFAHAISPLQNPKELTGLRRHIARLSTELVKRNNQA